MKHNLAPERGASRQARALLLRFLQHPGPSESLAGIEAALGEGEGRRGRNLKIIEIFFLSAARFNLKFRPDFRAAHFSATLLIAYFSIFSHPSSNPQSRVSLSVPPAS